ncbi:MAG: hypothetical protein LBH05_07045 [Deferribacteraceae bacterium]|jgi:hypothetical protein|nr:hypothetical protein [Deferribacteraceae bacterium]
MKKFTVLFFILLVCSPAFAQISSKHRGYDIPAKVEGLSPAGEDNNTEAKSIAPYDIYLVFSTGTMQGKTLSLDGEKFGGSSIGHTDISLHYFPYEYLGLGIGMFYYKGRTNERYDVFAPDDTAAVRYNTLGLSILMLGRYSLKNITNIESLKNSAILNYMGIVSQFETYFSAGITSNVNYVARDYTDNTDSENGSSVGCLFEVGIRWFMSGPAFIGISTRYTYNGQGSESSRNVDLGGISLFLNIGYNF